MEATNGTSEAPLRLSVVVPTGGDWADLADVVASLLPAVESLGVEVLAVSGCGGRPAAALPGIRYLAEDQTVTVDRALGPNENETVEATRNLPIDTALTHPYWLELLSTAGMAQVVRGWVSGEAG